MREWRVARLRIDLDRGCSLCIWTSGPICSSELSVRDSRSTLLSSSRMIATGFWFLQHKRYGLRGEQVSQSADAGAGRTT
jgi:hypothetical protein